MSFTHDEWEATHSRKNWGTWPRDAVQYFLNGLNTDRPHQEIKILDAGCGNGATMWLALNNRYDCYGIDISETAVKKTIEFLGRVGCKDAKVQVSDMAVMPFTDGFFDVVIDSCSLQCNPPSDQKTIVKEVSRVINPGGLYFLIYRDRKSWIEPLEQQIYPASDKELFDLLSPYFEIQHIEHEIWTEMNRKLPLIHLKVFSVKKQEKKE